VAIFGEPVTGCTRPPLSAGRVAATVAQDAGRSLARGALTPAGGAVAAVIGPTAGTPGAFAVGCGVVSVFAASPRLDEGAPKRRSSGGSPVSGTIGALVRSVGWVGCPPWGPSLVWCTVGVPHEPSIELNSQIEPCACVSGHSKVSCACVHAYTPHWRPRKTCVRLPACGTQSTAEGTCDPRPMQQQGSS
jgi:hypothetical protein